jgi:hypothetical protein
MYPVTIILIIFIGIIVTGLTDSIWPIVIVVAGIIIERGYNEFELYNLSKKCSELEKKLRQ